MQFVLPEPPPSLEINKDKFCLNQEKVKIMVSPNGGSLNHMLVKKENGEFYFYPTTVGTHTLTYTAPNGKAVSVEVQVLDRPNAAFEKQLRREGNKGHVFFIPQHTNATTLTWNFGDTSDPVTVNLGAGVKDSILHTYDLKEDGSGNFTVTLTAANAGCSADFKQEVIFAPRIEIKLKAEENICFNSDNRIEFEPKGGIFSSPTLQVNNKGQFKANQEGKHTITYTLGEDSANLIVFVLPNSFALENDSITNGNLRFDAVVLTPPKNVIYKWQLNEKELEVVTVKKEGSKSRFTFTAKIPNVNILRITLLMEQDEKRICNPINLEFPRVR
jgi:hypothetical protein